MLRLIDSFLNRITMYRLVLYYLIGLTGAAAVCGFFHVLPYSPEVILFSTTLILGTCWVTNYIFAKVFEATTNVESVYITAFILALIISPVSSSDAVGVGFLIFASAWAMASKYIFAIGKKHVFNPAAFGIAISTLFIDQSATWWVAGNIPLMACIVIGGLLIVRKIQRFDLVLSFITVALLTIVLTATNGIHDGANAVMQTLVHSPLLFLAFVMLTEPLTMSPSWYTRVLYGAMVGFLFAPNVHIGTYYFSPEVALLVGNIFVYLVSPKGRHILTLVEKREIGTNTLEFVFAPDRRFSFTPGQYLEWTLPTTSSDNRGNRRYFTIASSPAEQYVRLGVRFYEPYSSFKQTLRHMKPGDVISTAHLAGDFVLPRDNKKKLVFIAGGIGITPFRSMVQHLVDTHDTRTVTLLYSNKTTQEIAYKEVFDAANKSIGLKTVYAVTDEKSSEPDIYTGKIDAGLIAREIPDYKDRFFYLSGPHGMVEAFKKTLADMGVSRLHIQSDYFPGFM